MGRADAGAGGMPDQSLLVAGKAFGGEIDRAESFWRVQARATTAPSIFTIPGRRWTPRIKNISGSIAGAVKAFRLKHSVFPILVAMERLDTRACEALAPLLGGAPVFTSDAHDMYELVSVLRCCSLMVSSRYHAMVTSMPGLVPSAGITMDERIRNLMRERGHEDLLMTVDDPDLESKLLVVHGAAGGGSRRGARWHRAFGGAEFEDHGAHGSVSGASGAHVLSGVSGALGSARAGKNIFRRSARICSGCWKRMTGRRQRRPGIETELRQAFRSTGFSLWGFGLPRLKPTG